MRDRREYFKAWRSRQDENYIHKKMLRERYKTTPEWYESKLKEQNYGCALCGAKTQAEGDNKRLHVDHSHKCCETTARSCGKCLRGLLCFNCNKRLGFLELLLQEATTIVPKWDTWLENALLYLTRYGSR